MMAELKSEFYRPLVQVFDWAMNHEASPGELICPEHRVEHTGKTANIAILAAELFRGTGEARFRDAAVRLGLRVAERLEREGTSPCFTFRPGRHDPFNCSNSVIDGGAASDALATLVSQKETLGLSAEQLHTMALAALRHAQSYLRFAAVDKGVPAQRAWGLTGLTAALPLASETDGALAVEAFEDFEGCTPPQKWSKEMRAAADRALEILRGLQNQDGSFPYHPSSLGPGHPGATDVSSFYQSRVTGFMGHSILNLGEDPAAEPHRFGLEQGLDFLAGLYGPDGLKVGLVEAKPWYWGATYEVASHVFDTHAFGLGWRLFGRADFGRLAIASFRTWAAHLAVDGEPRSHREADGRVPSYQCAMFWASHAAWAARAVGDLQSALEAGLGEGPLELPAMHFKDAGLVRLSSPSLVAFVRGSRPPGNVNHGSVQGAGLLRVIQRHASLGDDRSEMIERFRFGSSRIGEWSGRSGSFSLGRGLRSGGKEVRFALWTARVHWRAGRWLDAVLDVPRAFRRAVLSFSFAEVSTAFARDVELEWIAPHEVHIRGSLAWRDGRAVAGTSFHRCFRINVQTGALEVIDRISAGASVRDLKYALPKAAVQLDDLDKAAKHEIQWSLAGA